VSTKQDPTLKNWLTTGSIAFGASCICSLPFTQNLSRSLFCGVATLPGVVASGLVRYRQCQQQLQRQVERGNLRLNELRKRDAILTETWQLRSKDLQTIESKIIQLQSLSASLNNQIGTNRLHQQQLEQQVAALTDYCQEQQTLATKIDRRIQDKQARSLEVHTTFNYLKAELSRLQGTKLQTIGEIDLLAEQLRQSKQELVTTNVQHLSVPAAESSTIELELQLKQVQLTELIATISERNNEIESCDRDLKMTQLELSSKQAELDNLEFRIHNKLQSLDDINLEIAKSI
jgi:chromosome segregation ATPase